MSLPIASCLICGEEKELAVFYDAAITGHHYVGVCLVCRDAARQTPT